MTFRTTKHYFNHVTKTLKEDASWEADYMFGPMTAFGRAVVTNHECLGQFDSFVKHMKYSLAGDLAYWQRRSECPEEAVATLSRLFEVSDDDIIASVVELEGRALELKVENQTGA